MRCNIKQYIKHDAPLKKAVVAKIVQEQPEKNDIEPKVLTWPLNPWDPNPIRLHAYRPHPAKPRGSAPNISVSGSSRDCAPRGQLFQNYIYKLLSVLTEHVANL